MDLLTVRQAADALGLTPRRVRQLIDDSALPARKYGRDWMIRKDHLEPLRRRRGPGRPRTVAERVDDILSGL